VANIFSEIGDALTAITGPSANLVKDAMSALEALHEAGALQGVSPNAVASKAASVVAEVLSAATKAQTFIQQFGLAVTGLQSAFPGLPDAHAAAIVGQAFAATQAPKTS
jgi:hypothetical protein